MTQFDGNVAIVGQLKMVLHDKLTTAVWVDYYPYRDRTILS